jgi:hypothetical protein
MLAKYHVNYAVPFKHRDEPHRYLTNDPVECEGFLADLLERGFKITGILHEGVALPPVEFDRLVKTAAGVLTTRHLCRSLGIDTAEAHHRFGSPA